ncbi:MAG: YhgE/Pip family protein [Adlercreutzia equolifaciens]
MNNVWRLFRFDLGRLKANVMSIIITLGLVLVPSLFAWYNIIACWNVFDNTGNLTVAVANTDEGYQSDLIPLRINIGDQVVSALRANDQIDWHITDEEDAIDGAKSGRYYAAVVIPKSFSRDMLTFYTGDAGHADIVYYANEKKSAIAPKITDQGADSVSYQVNAVFAQTLSEVSLSLAESLSSFADEDDWDGRIAVVADHVREMADAFDDASGVLSLYGSLAPLRGSLAPFGRPGHQASTALDETLSAATGRADAVPATVDALKSSADTLKSSLADSAAAFGAVSDSVDALFDAASGDSQGIAKDLRAQADALASHATVYRQVADSLEGAAPSLPESLRPQVTALAGRARAVASQADSMAASLRTAADKLEAGDTDLSAERDAAKAKAASRRLHQFHQGRLRGECGAGARLAGRAGRLHGRCALRRFRRPEGRRRRAVRLGHLGGRCHGRHRRQDSRDHREAQGRLLGAAGDGLRYRRRHRLGRPRRPARRARLRCIGPFEGAVRARRRRAHPGVPVENFGSAMAPHTTLALFIGSLFILVVFKPKAGLRIQKEAGLVNKPRQLFFGRFAVMAVVSLAQSTVMALGNLFFLDVQVTSPWLFMVCFWGAGLVFTFIIYALVVSFANLGKAIAVLLLIVQVTGCGGSFPLQIMPDFVQALSPWLPATHVVNAMRSAMMGTYGGDFWAQMGALALFLIPAALLGLVLRKPLEKFMEWYVEKVESSKLIS